MVADEFRFETFVEAQGTAMQEYLSGVVAKLSKTDKEYRAIQNKIEEIYKCQKYLCPGLRYGHGHLSGPPCTA